MNRALLVNLSLALATTLALLGGLELLARVFDLGERQPVADYIAHWNDQWGGEFYVFESGSDINTDGLRDVEHEIWNPEGRRRIVILGDSVEFGFKLPRTSSWPAMLQRLLDGAPASAEIFNVALPGWSARQQRIAYETLVRKYRPDHVVLAVCLNDIPEMQNNLSRPSAVLAFGYRHSNLFRFVVGAELRDIRNVKELFLRPDAASVRNGWELYFQEVRKLARSVREDGAEFAIVVFPFRFQLGPEAPEPVPQRVLAAFGEEHAIPQLDLLPELSRAGRDVFIDRDHLSTRGATLAARAVIRSGLIGDFGL